MNRRISQPGLAKPTNKNTQNFGPKQDALQKQPMDS